MTCTRTACSIINEGAHAGEGATQKNAGRGKTFLDIAEHTNGRVNGNRSGKYVTCAWAHAHTVIPRRHESRHIPERAFPCTIMRIENEIENQETGEGRGERAQGSIPFEVWNFLPE